MARTTRTVVAAAAAVAALAALASPASAAVLAFGPVTTLPGSPTLVDVSARNVVVSDFDADGSVDILGIFQNAIEFGGPNPGSQPLGALGATGPAVDVVDIDGNGRPDILFTALGGTLAAVAPGLGGAVAPGDPRARFGALIPVDGGSARGKGSHVIADLNDDGADDLVTYDALTGGGVVQLGSRTGTPLAERIAFAGFFVGVKSADLDVDGFVDIVLISALGGQRSATVYQGGPTGYTLAATLPTAIFPVGNVIGDVNGDGLLDLGDGLGGWALQTTAPDPVIPEVPLAVLLPLTAALVTGAVLLRPRSRARVVAP